MKIISLSIFIVTILYLVMIFAGYLSTFQNTPPIILQMAPAFPSWSLNWPLIPSQVLIMSTMVTNIMLNYIPFRNSLNYMINNSNEISKKFNLICTALFQTATCLVSIVFPNVQSVLSVFGGIASVNIVYIVPCKCPIALICL